MIHAIDSVDWATVRQSFADEVDVDYSELFGQPRATMAADTLMAGWREIGVVASDHPHGAVKAMVGTHVRLESRAAGLVGDED